MCHREGGDGGVLLVNVARETVENEIGLRALAYLGPMTESRTSPVGPM
jgi:hypothetical protein